MFDSVLLEVPRGERRRRRLTLFVTLAGEAVVVAAPLSLPLLYLDAIPGLSLRVPAAPITLSPQPALEQGSALGPAEGRSVALARRNDEAIVRRTVPNPQLVYPNWRNDSDTITTDPGLVRPGPCCASSDLLVPNTAYVPAPPKLPRVVRTSNIDPGMILRRVEPVYPRPAIIARIQGDVVLHATIGKDGALERLQVLSGPPMLIESARAAVQQWTFRPYRLNGAPIEVETRITVHFRLAGSQD